MVTFTLQNLDNDIHDLGAERRAAHEDAFDDAGGECLKLCIRVLNELEGWVAQFVQLGCDQVLKHINGGEAWDLVTLVHRDSAFDCHV